MGGRPTDPPPPGLQCAAALAAPRVLEGLWTAQRKTFWIARFQKYHAYVVFKENSSYFLSFFPPSFVQSPLLFL